VALTTYLRFSAPGKSGFVPGTSKNKGRSAWIEAEDFKFIPEDGKPVANPPNGFVASLGPVSTRMSFSHLVDASANLFFRFSSFGTAIDTVTLEVERHSHVILSLQFDSVLIDSFVFIGGTHSVTMEAEAIEMN
jgi:hypothetical protein